ncbi:MAG: MBL fold metallo-hydrolase [Desulfobacteraceae bacterium]|nr:MBL fold metallo-hydrolase [Desulfobacteraceae bacterium]
MVKKFDYEQREPFKIIDNIFYVGSTFVSCWLFTSKDGHVLVDTGLPGDGTYIAKHIEQLGFSVGDIKYILVTHPHVDHIGSLAYLKERTGAIVCAGKRDVFFIENDNKVVGSDVLELPEVEPCKVDRMLREGDRIEVGPISLRIYETPGHSAGATSFGFQVSDQGKEYAAILYGGFGVNVFDRENRKHNVYGANIDMYIASLERAKNFDVDLWLTGHWFFDRTFEKLEIMEQQNEIINPFIDPDGWNSFLTNHINEAKELRKEISV